MRFVILLSIAAAACELVDCTEFTAVFDACGKRQCAVGLPDDVRLSSRSIKTATLECARFCDANPECIVFNLYDNTTCQIFTCSTECLEYQIVEFCKSFRVSLSLVSFVYWNLRYYIRKQLRFAVRRNWWFDWEILFVLIHGLKMMMSSLSEGRSNGVYAISSWDGCVR